MVGSLLERRPKHINGILGTGSLYSAVFPDEGANEIVPKLIASPTRVPAAGNKPKIIDEYVGALNTQESAISIAHMRSPEGWKEPGQKPEFREFTVVLSGTLHVEYESGSLDVGAGQAIVCEAGEWVRYSTPEQATEYIAICLPAFSPHTVHRDQ